MLPNLIVIGAQKAGTTSLYHYLLRHPEIWMSREKELHFFVERANWRRGVAWYEGFFPHDVPVRGEADPWYTQYPQHDGVPERMADLVPDVKLIYLVRDPIERLVSDYVMSVRLGKTALPLSEALGDLSTSNIILRSRYWLQLERYLAHFAPEQILVLDGHDLQHRRQHAMRRAFRFLGVDDAFTSPAWDTEHNPRPTRRRRKPAAAVVGWMTRNLGARRVVQMERLVPRPLYLAFTAKMSEPALDDGLRARLQEHLAADVEQLRAFTGEAFATWSV